MRLWEYLRSGYFRLAFTVFDWLTVLVSATRVSSVRYEILLILSLSLSLSLFIYFILRYVYPLVVLSFMNVYWTSWVNGYDSIMIFFSYSFSRTWHSNRVLRGISIKRVINIRVKTTKGKCLRSPKVTTRRLWEKRRDDAREEFEGWGGLRNFCRDKRGEIKRRATRGFAEDR